MTTTNAVRHLQRPDGRRLAVYDLTPAAPADAPVVLFCHAAPGSGAFDPDPAVTAASGVRLIAVDRPGYGGSDPLDDAFATVSSAADDAAAVLDDVLVPGTTAGVVGWSAGGRVALALAARRPELVERVAVVATPAPDDEVPWIPAEHRAGIEAMRGLPAADAQAALTAALAPMLDAFSGDARFALVGAGEADAAVLAQPGVVERLRGLCDAAFAQGGVGMVADINGYTLQPWGFDPAEVRVPVLLAYGAADDIGPGHGTWWRGVLPDAQLEVVPDVGHLLVVPIWERVLAHLARR